MFIVEGHRAGRPITLNAPHLEEAVRIAAWAVADAAFLPDRILDEGGRVIVEQARLGNLVARLISDGAPLL